ncbi:TonB-dependent receptor [Tunicatimonas pelagia]|uniref:TonB-dependent receptor n=1 Tax=Tunicatimonas pelagia TaxID=931531 RepID=UPI002665D8CD|nr:TonB-dependent receptor [Tunicatimonas pelagia]WKN44158.1 TonB-dependent receptor [Tunicatimonas pelagia]
MNHCYAFLTALIISINLGYGQSPSVSGEVYSEDGEKLLGVYVQLNNKQATVTDEAGRFVFKNLEAGKYILTASFMGFQALEKSFTLAEGQTFSLNLELEEEVTQLSEVTVTGKSEARELRESTASVAVLETKDLYTQSNNTSDVIKQISGVNVRQTGGFGSEAEVSISGMSGKQVKFFLDGIPLTYFGSGLGLNVLPVNLMEQIEVYKGVVPVHLGADALGGAINIVSRKEYSSYLDAAYSFGSFNSHRANLNGQFISPETNFLFGVNAFYNHSDNNYFVDVEIPNEFGNPEPARVRRFHDQFSNYLLNVYVGVVDKPYADRLILSVRYSGLGDDLQHNAIMAQPYGEVVYSESTRGLSLEYEKRQLLPNTDLQWYGGLNHTAGNFTDTTLNAYTWDGEVYRRRTDGGEISASRNLLQLNSRNAVSRLNINHEPWKNGRITLNVFTSWFQRTGEDPVAAEFYGQDYYANPTVLMKNATGLAYEHTLGKALVSYTALKHYAYSADGYAIQNLEFQPNQQSVSNFGYAQSFRYSFTDKLLAKASYEYATRLPDEIELFGDFTLVRPNPFLKPEQSHNANVGGQFSSKMLNIELNGFFRHTDNIIWLRTSQFFAQYQNLLQAMIRGVDAEVQFRPFDFLKITANATYQDIRNRSPRQVTGSVDDRYYDARLPNMPYLFGNGEIRYQKNSFLNSENQFSAWWSANYVHDFFLFWAVDGREELKNTIPAQFIQNVGISYALPDNRLSLSLEATNLLDQKAFDNFSVQRPGRALYATLRTYFNKK